MPYQLLADAVLTLHVAIVVFVVAGLAAIVAGNLRGWSWINRFWLRALHLAAIAYVAAEAWFGAVCPLTRFEMWLRARGSGSIYSGSFVEHWLQRLLYYEAPAWVFVAAYTVFALAVLAAWVAWPPGRSR